MDPFERCVDWLKRLGLQEYQAKAYVALVANPDSFGPDVSKISGVPEPKIYGILKALEREGFVMTSLGRPKRYRAIGIESAAESLIERHRSKTEFLEREKAEMVKELNGIAGDYPDRNGSVWMVEGAEAVENEIYEIMNNIKRNYNVVFTPELFRFFFSSKKLKGIFKELVNKNEIRGNIVIPKSCIENGSKIDGVNTGLFKKSLKLNHVKYGILDDSEIEMMFSIEDDIISCITFIDSNNELPPKKLIIRDKNFSDLLKKQFKYLWNNSFLLN